MDVKTNSSASTGLSCRVCGHFGSEKCLPDSAPQAACESFLSWADLWQREMAAIKRAQRTTYIVAALVAALAVLVMILPNLIG